MNTAAQKAVASIPAPPPVSVELPPAAPLPSIDPHTVLVPASGEPLAPDIPTAPEPVAQALRADVARAEAQQAAIARIELPEPAQPLPAEISASADASSTRIDDEPFPASPEPEVAAPTINVPSADTDGDGKDEPALLFEVAWEVCWQLGGIYTVLRTKAPAMLERWGKRYCLIGPYNPRTAAVEFEEQPTEGVIRAALDRLRDQGIPCHFGRWLIPGRPRVILLDYRARFPKLGEDKYLMWADHGISLPADDGETNEVVAFGFTVLQFFQELVNVAPGQPVLGHFHEWMGGVAIPRIAHLRLPVTTVFTTHATLLGRYLAGDNPHFYSHLPHLDPDAEARKYQIFPRHLIEKAGAHASTVFTTVSDVTAIEAEKLLGRAPDVIVPNGLNTRTFAAIHEFQNLHRKYKERIHEFVMGHFFPSYAFDLDRTLYLFTSGRYEYKNKGLDIFIESLHRLNERLKASVDPPTVVAFIITRAPTKNINVGVLQNQIQLGDLRNLCDEVKEQMGNKLFNAIAAGRLPTFNELVGEESWVQLKRAIHAQHRPFQPPIVTHDLWDDAKDPVLNHLRHRGLFNSENDPVKVIFHPEFVTATSPLLGLDYEQFVRGCHLGVFPSYYEPWGYTPMESLAMGVPAVTTDLSGFGAYVTRTMKDYAQNGIAVIERRNRDFNDGCEQLVATMMNFSQQSRRQRIELRNKVERVSEQFDWSKLIRHYHDAHDLALERTGGKRPGRFELKMV